MKIYEITSAVTLRGGLLLLNEKQADRRAHVLVKQETKVSSLKLADDEFKAIGVSADKLAVYKLAGTTQFKVGEKIGYDGELNKAQAAMLKPATEAEPEAEIEQNIDAALVNAIAELDKNNSAHFNAQGKPQIEILAGLLQRKVTGKERDAAFAYYKEHGAIEIEPADDSSPVPGVAADLFEVLSMLDESDDSLYEDDGSTPKLEVINGLLGRECTADELEAALNAIDEEQAGDSE